MAIYQARFNKYLDDRGIKDTSQQHVWAFLGDGECDEPETLGAITLASREELDNLIFVINCNLQRLDGPVRGNGKIIQELEAIFRGAGWNVIKVIWGDDWDPLLAKDEAACSSSGWAKSSTASIRSTSSAGRVHPRALLRQVSRAARAGQPPLGREAQEAPPRRARSGEGLCRLQGGRRDQGPADGDPRQDDQGLRPGRSRRRPQHHPPAEEAQRGRAARVPHALRHSHLRRGRGQGAVLQAAGRQPGDAVPARAPRGAGRLRARRASRWPTPLEMPKLADYDEFLEGSGDKELSTTMGFVRLLTQAAQRQGIGKYIVPIVPDEIAHVRHGGAVPPGAASTPTPASSTSRSIRT